MENIENKNFDQVINTELEPKPKYRLMITRHAERLPSGALTPEGIENAKIKGHEMQGSAEVLAGYASDHPSKRAADTANLISGTSEIKSQKTGRQYRTKEVADIQYSVFEPDLYHLIPAAKDYIEEATLKALKWSTERDEKGKLKINIEKIPLEEQKKIAPIRQKFQKLGFEFFFEKHPEAIHRMALGLAHQLVKELDIAKRYKSRRESMGTIQRKDIVFNTATHGMFMESLLREAGVYKHDNGTETDGIKDFDNPEFGGYIQPAESCYLDIDNPNNLPDKIPVVFEDERRPKNKVFISLEKLKKLDSDYQIWKNSLNER